MSVKFKKFDVPLSNTYDLCFIKSNSQFINSKTVKLFLDSLLDRVKSIDLSNCQVTPTFCILHFLAIKFKSIWLLVEEQFSQLIWKHVEAILSKLSFLIYPFESMLKNQLSLKRKFDYDWKLIEIWQKIKEVTWLVRKVILTGLQHTYNTTVNFCIKKSNETTFQKH